MMKKGRKPKLNSNILINDSGKQKFNKLEIPESTEKKKLKNTHRAQKVHSLNEKESSLLTIQNFAELNQGKYFNIS